MGALLALLRSDADVSTDVFVDFENAKPTPEEQDLYHTVQEKLAVQAALLQSLKSYTGCGEQIRKAISSPGKKTEDEAWNAVCPAVGELKEYYNYSTVLEECFLKLLRHLCVTEGSATIKSNLEKFQSTVFLLSRLLVFALDFDDLKMSNPSIQNDFSYYRRTLSRLKMSAEHKEVVEMAVVKDELANRMSLFYAHANPMLKVLEDGLANMINQTSNGVNLNNVTECLTTMAVVCHVAVTKNKFAKPETGFFCLRVMVASISLYDHVHPVGAFAKGSDLQVKSHIKLIQTNGGNHTEALLNVLRYTTKHLNDESTPKAIKSMLT